MVSGASLTAPTVIEAVAGLASSAPVLSIAGIVEAGRAVEVGRRHKVHRRCIAGGRHRAVQHDAVVRPASVYSVPFNGRLVMRNDATVPSMSEPDSETAIEAAFSSPKPEPALVSGASLTAPTLIEAVAGLASSAPVLSIAA